MLAAFHQPVSQMISQVDYYLRMPVSGYLGRRMEVFAEPMGPSSHMNARQYGSDYLLVLSPDAQGFKLDPIRHLYLHFILDPLATKHYNQIKALEPLLNPSFPREMFPGRSNWRRQPCNERMKIRPGRFSCWRARRVFATIARGRSATSRRP